MGDYFHPQFIVFPMREMKNSTLGRLLAKELRTRTNEILIASRDKQQRHA